MAGGQAGRKVGIGRGLRRRAIHHCVQFDRHPFGSIYGGNMVAVYAVFIGFGAGIGWLSKQKIGDEDDRPVPPLVIPREPYE
jgi:hypothetical protein